MGDAENDSECVESLKEWIYRIDATIWQTLSTRSSKVGHEGFRLKEDLSDQEGREVLRASTSRR